MLINVLGLHNHHSQEEPGNVLPKEEEVYRSALYVSPLSVGHLGFFLGHSASSPEPLPNETMDFTFFLSSERS